MNNLYRFLHKKYLISLIIGLIVIFLLFFTVPIFTQSFNLNSDNATTTANSDNFSENTTDTDIVYNANETKEESVIDENKQDTNQNVEENTTLSSNSLTKEDTKVPNNENTSANLHPKNSENIYTINSVDTSRNNGKNIQKNTPKEKLSTPPPPIVAPPTPKAVKPLLQQHKIGRSSLTNNEVAVYDIIYDAIENLETEVSIPNTPPSSINKIFGYYLNDSPEHFYINNIGYQVLNGNAISLVFRYLYTPKNIQSKKAMIQNEVNKVLNGASNLKTDYDKSKYIYDYIVNKTVYNANGPESIYWIDGVLLNGTAVCQGYAKTYQLLTNLLGIKSTYVRGTSRNENHGWNLVRLDGKFYHVDPTWADLNIDGANGIDYTYLHLTTKQIQKDHNIDRSKNAPLPVANSLDNYYFVKTNSIINNNKTDRNKMVNLVKNTIKKGQVNVTIKFSSQQQLNEMLTNSNLLADIVFEARDNALSEGYTGFKFGQFVIVKNELSQTINIVFS